MNPVSYAIWWKQDKSKSLHEFEKVFIKMIASIQTKMVATGTKDLKKCFIEVPQNISIDYIPDNFGLWQIFQGYARERH